MLSQLLLPYIASAQTNSPAGTSLRNHLKVAALVNPQRLYSTAVWTAVTNNASRMNFLQGAESLQYVDDTTLITRVRETTSTLAPDDYLLIIGPGQTGEAILLEQEFTNLNKHVYFLSPSISTTNTYNNIQLIKACLPDIERVQRLKDIRPDAWQAFPATCVYVNNAWGALLLENLQGAQSNICQSLDFHPISEARKTTHEEICQAAKDCISHRTPLIFLTMEAPQVSDFLNQLQPTGPRGLSVAPYRPTICLLGDFIFSTSAHSEQVIPLTKSSSACITMLSETQVRTNELETGDSYERLTRDVLELLNELNRLSSGNASQFLQFATAVFARQNDSAQLLEHVSPETSQYLLSLKTGAESCRMKWLESTTLSRQPIQWNDVHSTVSRSWWHFKVDTFCSAVPWLNSLPTIGGVFAALLIGLGLEARKRYIFVQRTAWAITWRILAGFGAISSLFVLLVWAYYTRRLTTNEPTFLLMLCVSPLAILPTLKHASFTKIPILSQGLDTFTKGTDLLLDRWAKSRSRVPLATHVSLVNQFVRDRAASQKDYSWKKAENELWAIWLDLLRACPSVGRAQKIYERYLPRLKVCDHDFAEESRVKELAQAVAYTCLVTGGSLPVANHERPTPGGTHSVPPEKVQAAETLAETLARAAAVTAVTQTPEAAISGVPQNPVTVVEVPAPKPEEVP